MRLYANAQAYRHISHIQQRSIQVNGKLQRHAVCIGHLVAHACKIISFCIYRDRCLGRQVKISTLWCRVMRPFSGSQRCPRSRGISGSDCCGDPKPVRAWRLVKVFIASALQEHKSIIMMPSFAPGQPNDTKHRRNQSGRTSTALSL